jgi:hypothetical protein
MKKGFRPLSAEELGAVVPVVPGEPARKTVSEIVEGILKFSLSAAALCWLAYVFYAPYRSLKLGEFLDTEKPRLAAGRALLKELPDLGEWPTPSVVTEVFPDPIWKNVRLEPRGGNNLEIYLPTDEFESVPYPDRDGFVARVGRAWCENTGPGSHIFLPSVKFRDIRTGDHLASYHCIGLLNFKEMVR